METETVFDQYILATLSRYYAFLPLNLSQRKTCLGFVKSQLNGVQGNSDVLHFLTPYQAICFITLYDQEKAVFCGSGFGHNASVALLDAITNTQQAYSPSKRIALCFLFDPQAAHPDQIKLGLDGLSIHDRQRVAYFKNSVPIHHGFNLNTTLDKLRQKAGISSPENIHIIKYRALEFRETEGQLCDCYRGNILLLPSDVKPGALEKSLNKAIDNLHRAIAQAKIASLADLTRYIASIGQLVVSNSPKPMIVYLQKIIERYFDYKKGCLIFSNKTHLGVNSFLLFALISLNESSFEKEKQLLIEYIINQFDPQKKCFNLSDEQALLYAGEALLALATLFETQKNARALQISQSCLPYYQRLFDQSENKLMMCHWFSKAYSKLYQITHDERCAEFVFQMNDVLLQYQIPVDFDQVDLIGAFSMNGDARMTATLTESIQDALTVATIKNDLPRCERYSQAILLGLRALLQTETQQGFQTSLFDSSIRIDNLQHAISTLIHALKHNYTNNTQNPTSSITKRVLHSFLF